MCGFALISNQNEVVSDEKILDILRRRGPDSEAYLSVNKLKLYHSRLSIRDLTSAGSQPMEKNGVYICYNGELYNEEDLIKSLDSDRYKLSRSDTETLLDYYIKYGLKKTLIDINGMYAFTIVDLRKKKVFVVSDRFGEKPVYFSENLIRCRSQKIDTFCVSSEIKVVATCLAGNVNLRADSVREFLEFGYISAPFTIYDDILKMEPGSFLELTLNGCDQIIEVSQFKYFDPKNAKNESRPRETYADFKRNISHLLESSVHGAMSSDVPVCTMLSGGIDSSLITHFASLNRKKTVSYTLGFSKKGFDETTVAKFVADKLGIENRNILFDPDQLETLINDSVQVYGEPFADSSQIAAIIMSSEISKDFKVCMTGDGADEIFYGYNRHVFAPKLWQITKHTPKFLLRALASPRIAREMEALTATLLTRFGYLDKRTHRIEHKLRKAIFALQAESYSELYLRLHSSQRSLDTRASNYQHKLICDPNAIKNTDTLSQIIRNIDLKTYLSGDILVKMDRASMHYGLETRAPFLNHRLLSYTNSVPLDFLVHKSKGKRVLRDLAADIFGTKFSRLPKKGFSVPIQEYIYDYADFNHIIEFFSEDEAVKEYLPVIKTALISDQAKEYEFEFLWRVIILYKWLKLNL